jgi:hypothetical protein
MGDKYLEISIRAGSTSVVEIIISGLHGNRVTLSHSALTALFEKRAVIKEFVKTTLPSRAGLIIQDLDIRIIKSHDENTVRLAFRDRFICLKPSSVFFLLDLEHCVQNIYYYLHQSTHAVSEKYKEFVSLLRRSNNVFNKSDAIKLLHEKFNRTSILDCELLTYALDCIVDEALRDQ